MEFLFVDDNHSLFKAMNAVLAKENYVVYTAADGQDTWKLATVFNYDLILL